MPECSALPTRIRSLNYRVLGYPLFLPFGQRLRASVHRASARPFSPFEGMGVALGAPGERQIMRLGRTAALSAAR